MPTFTLPPEQHLYSLDESNLPGNILPGQIALNIAKGTIYVGDDSNSGKDPNGFVYPGTIASGRGWQEYPLDLKTFVNYLVFTDVNGEKDAYVALLDALKTKLVSVDRYATESQRGIAELATYNEAIGGSDPYTIMTPLRVKQVLPVPSTETVLGKARLATLDEAITGEDNTTIMTPRRVKDVLPVQAITTVAGIAQIATLEEAEAGDNNETIMTPLRVKQVKYVQNTETTLGVARIATISEASGNDNFTMMTPAKVKAQIPTQALDNYAGICRIATTPEANAGSLNNVIMTPAKVKPLIPTQANENNIGIAAVATEAQAIAGNLDTVMMTPLKVKPLIPVQATMTSLGVAQIANDTEADNLSLDTVIMTPLKVGRVLPVPASELTAGKAALATQAQAEVGTNDTTIMTPLKVKQAIGTLVPPASETVAGIAQLSSNAEADGLGDDLTIMTPKKVARVLPVQATESLLGIAELASDAEADGKLNDLTIMTPKKVARVLPIQATTGTAGIAKSVEVSTFLNRTYISSSDDDNRYITPRAFREATKEIVPVNLFNVTDNYALHTGQYHVFKISRTGGFQLFQEILMNMPNINIQLDNDLNVHVRLYARPGATGVVSTYITGTYADIVNDGLSATGPSSGFLASYTYSQDAGVNVNDCLLMRQIASTTAGGGRIKFLSDLWPTIVLNTDEHLEILVVPIDYGSTTMPTVGTITPLRPNPDVPTDPPYPLGYRFNLGGVCVSGSSFQQRLHGVNYDALSPSNPFGFTVLT